jgi:RNA polymerase sigma-70 factor (ECF subfamily)
MVPATLRCRRVGEDDADLVARLRAGDEQAFAGLVERYHSPMVRLAATYVPNRAVAEEVVQDTWLGVLRGIDRFEGRSSFKTWLFRILVNRARTSGKSERRSVPMGGGEEAVEPDRFAPTGHWAEPPVPWSDAVEDRLVAAELARHARLAIEELPPGPRQVVTLRDIEGLSSTEVCDVLAISAANQRVLLHRGRTRVRRALEQQVGGPR